MYCELQIQDGSSNRYLTCQGYECASDFHNNDNMIESLIPVLSFLHSVEGMSESCNTCLIESHARLVLCQRRRDTKVSLTPLQCQYCYSIPVHLCRNTDCNVGHTGCIRATPKDLRPISKARGYMNEAVKLTAYVAHRHVGVDFSCTRIPVCSRLSSPGAYVVGQEYTVFRE